jgi:hypothetical protein
MYSHFSNKQLHRDESLIFTMNIPYVDCCTLLLHRLPTFHQILQTTYHIMCCHNPKDHTACIFVTMRTLFLYSKWSNSTILGLMLSLKYGLAPKPNVVGSFCKL